MNSVKILLVALLICALILPAPLVAFATEITPDPAAPAANRPGMDAASNGVPVVNIVAPASSGLSHNMFLDFNVGTQGVIINNSNKPGISHLGGGLMDNPNFHGGAQAKTILNEVTSNRPSSIQGFTEIFGGKADYILANPNGVSVNGGGFINTSRALITTGSPHVAGGKLHSIDVTQGDVSVLGDGINAEGADSFTILSRAATIAADIHAKKLAIMAGRNSYDPASGTATPLGDAAADDPAPTVAIDSSALGGMYANRIVLIANEKGVGVNLEGVVNADTMSLSADGKLTFKQLQAGSAADITAGSVNIAAGSALVSRGDIKVSAGTITNSGLTYSGGTTTLLADASLTNNAGSIVAKGDLIMSDAQQTTPGMVDVVITNEGGLMQSQAGNVSVIAGTFLNKIELLDIRRKLLSTHYVPRFDGKGAVSAYIAKTWGTRPGNARALTETTYKYEEYIEEKTPTPQVLAGHDLTIDAKSITNDHGLIAAKNDMVLRGTTLDNKGSAVSYVEHTDRTYYIYRAGGSGGSPSRATHDDYETISTVPATIAAGGTLTGDFTDQIDNETIKHTADYEGVISASDGPELPPGEASGRVDTSVAGMGSLFVETTDTAKPYLLETNPLIADLGTFYGSEYFLNRMGWDLDTHHQKALGDAFFETEMVRQQILELNSRSVVASIDQPEADMMMALMDNAVEAGAALDLSVGIELTAEQVAALDKDIVWFVASEYEGQSVLVPKVYLAAASRATVVGNGAKITAKNVNLQTANLNNSGDITGSTVHVGTDEVRNIGGRLEGEALVVDASGSILNRSGAIMGGDVTLTAGQDVVNETSVRRESFEMGHLDRLNQAATIASTGTLHVQAGNNISVKAGQIATGGDATLHAGNDVEIGSVIKTEAHNMRNWKLRAARHEGSNVDVGGDFQVTAGGEITVAGSAVHADGDMALQAEKNVSIAATQDVVSTEFHSSGKKTLFGGGGSTTKTSFSVTNHGSAVTAGGTLSVQAGTAEAEHDVAILGSAVAAGGDVHVDASGAVVVASVENSYEAHKTSSSKGFLSSSSSKQDRLTVQQVGSTVAGENVHLNAGKDVTVSASTVQANNDVTLKSEAGDVRVIAAQDRHYSYSEEKKSSAGFWVHGGGIDIARSSDAMSKAARETNVGSQIVAGNTVTVDADNDATIVGSQISADNDVNITAGRDVNLVPGREASRTETRSKTTTSGLSWSFGENEISIGAGTKSVETGETLAGQYNTGAVVSAGNDVSITADRNINQVSSHVQAGKDVSMQAGENLNVVAAKDVEELDRFVRETEVGVKLAAKQGVTSAVRQLGELPSAIKAGKGNVAAEAITGVSAVLRGVAAAKTITDASVSISATAGLSVSQTNEHTKTETPVTSSISAGNDIAMKAEKDITIQGAQVHAGNDATIEAGRNLTIESASGGMNYDSNSMTVSAGGGIKGSVGVNGAGYGANAYASLSGSDSDYTSSYNRNAAIVADKNVSTKSGSDTTVSGAHIQGETVNMDVGGDLTVASRQDASEGSSSSYGVSADVMIGVGASASVSGNVGKGKSSSGWVHDQTSIIGKEGVDIHVGDNTHVEGAVIAAENGNLKLDTNTLTYADIHDHDTASNINVGVSVSGSYGGGGYSTQKSLDSILGTESGSKAAATKTGADDDSDKGLHSPSGSVSVDYSSKDRRQINRATIGEGTIIIRSDPNAGLEGLNRDLARAQEITKDSETAVSVYIDSDAIKEVASGFEGIIDGFENVGEGLQQLAREYKAFTAVLPSDMKHLGDAGLAVMQNMILGGATDEDIAALMQDVEFQKVLTQVADLQYALQHGSIESSVQGKSASRDENGNIVINVYGKENIREKVLTTLSSAKNYFDSIPYKEEAALAILGLQTLLVGPVKTAFAVVGDIAKDTVAGEVVQQVKTAFATEIASQLRFEQPSTIVVQNAERFGYSEQLSEDVAAAEFGINILVGSVGTIIGGKAVLGGGGFGKGGVKLSYDKVARTWTSPAGVVYGADRKFGNRIKHVLAHGVEDSTKSIHSVFNVSKDQILGIVDEAWMKNITPFRDGGLDVRIVNLGRVVGTQGEKMVRIVTKPGTSRIISAYPVK